MPGYDRRVLDSFAQRRMAPAPHKPLPGWDHSVCHHESPKKHAGQERIIDAPADIRLKPAWTVMYTTLSTLLFAVLLLVAFPPADVESVAPAAPPDTTWTWPEISENLKVLPTNTGSAELRGTMVGFVFALGVRCQHCHIGTEEMSLEEFDFVSDVNPNKNIAREMMMLAAVINGELGEIEGLGNAEGPRVTCYTCHRGSTQPETIAPMPPRPPPPEDEDGG